MHQKRRFRDASTNEKLNGINAKVIILKKVDMIAVMLIFNRPCIIQ